MIYLLFMIGCVSSIHSRNETNLTSFDDFMSHLPELDEATMAFMHDEDADDDFLSKKQSNSRRGSTRRRRRASTTTILEPEVDEPVGNIETTPEFTSQDILDIIEKQEKFQTQLESLLAKVELNSEQFLTIDETIIEIS